MLKTPKIKKSENILSVKNLNPTKKNCQSPTKNKRANSPTRLPKNFVTNRSKIIKRELL